MSKKTEINYNRTLSDIKNVLNVQCIDSDDTGDLIMASTTAVGNNIDILYLSPKSIPLVWGWTDKTHVKLYGSVDFNIKTPAKQMTAIKNCLNSGAEGMLVSANAEEIERITQIILPLKDEIFFKRELVLGVNLNKFYFDLVPSILYCAKILNLSKLAIVIDKNINVVPWAFGFFQSLPKDVKFDIEIVFKSDNLEQIENMLRLAESMSHDLESKIKFVVPFSFFNYYPKIEE